MTKMQEELGIIHVFDNNTKTFHYEIRKEVNDGTIL